MDDINEVLELPESARSKSNIEQEDFLICIYWELHI